MNLKVEGERTYHERVAAILHQIEAEVGAHNLLEMAILAHLSINGSIWVVLYL